MRQVEGDEQAAEEQDHRDEDRDTRVVAICMAEKLVVPVQVIEYCPELGRSAQGDLWSGRLTICPVVWSLIASCTHIWLLVSCRVSRSGRLAGLVSWPTKTSWPSMPGKGMIPAGASGLPLHRVDAGWLRAFEDYIARVPRIRNPFE